MTAPAIQTRRPVKKYLFARRSKFSDHPVLAAVEAFDKDHAILRLSLAFPFADGMDWDFLDELDPDHYVGAMGHDLPLTEH